MPSGRSPPPGFGISTRRTGAGRYVFSIKSVPSPESHSSRPAASIIAKLIPSTRCARIRARQVVGVAQDVFPINLVVEQVEAEVRLRLRLEIQLPLKPPDAIGCLQAHRQSPIIVFFGSTPEVRVLSSAGVTRLHRSYDPVRLPPTPPPSAASRSLPSCRTGLPRLLASPFQRAVPIAPADRDGCFCRLLPHPTRAFPVMQAGRHPRLHFRGLLRLHACYGPLDRSTAQSGLRHEASTRPVTQPGRSSATRSHRQLPGWLLPPLVIRAVGAHVESRKGAVAWAMVASRRFPSPLIKPDVRISRIRLSDWLHLDAHGGGPR